MRGSREATGGWQDAVLSPATLARIAELVQSESGIVINEDKASLVQARLMRRLRATKIGDFESYLRFIRSPLGADERKQMLRSLTTNVTKFYREPHHFDDLNRTVLAAAAARVRNGGRLRIWSAACSTGEEPYSIAMELCTFFTGIERYDVKILATDIDSDVLAIARTGLYPGRAIATLPPARRQFFADNAADHPTRMFPISESARSVVTFRVLNLLKDWPFGGRFDAIFCRNVLIYFNRATQEKIFERFGAVTAPDGRLYIGHSERLIGSAQSQFRNSGTTTYARLAMQNQS